MDWASINWFRVWDYVYIGITFPSAAVVIYTTFRVYRSGKKTLQTQREYNDALEKATAHLKANPQAWLDAMAALDDKRRMH
jgi:hypothetical protein